MRHPSHSSRAQYKPGLLGFMLIFASAAASSATLSGELRQWHPISLTFDGPTSSETADPNPFLDYRLDVTFEQNGDSYVVPGYFAGDGSGGAGGDQWRVQFAPPATGDWSWTASFRTGDDVAVADSPLAGSSTSFDGETGAFTVVASDKDAPDFRATDRGLLKQRGHHYLTFASGQHWVKGGPDIPENFLGYDGFDNTPNANHSFSAHVSDWRAGDPDWGNQDGRAIIGALNYIADRQSNTIYFLPMNIGGDGRDTFPTIGEQTKTRYDLSKLRQWEIVFAHAQSRGISLHFVLAETESGNENYHDNGQLGPERKLYYRMLLARFGHHNAVQFNIGEENDYGTERRREFAAFIKSIDPYDHPVTTHTNGGQYESFYAPLLGNGDFDITSFQGGNSRSSMYDLIKDWRERSAAAGVPWAISFDEPQKIENDINDVNNGYPHGRRDKMWPAYMGGAAGFEWYVQQDGGGHSFDQNIDDFSIMDEALSWAGHATQLLESLPLLNMMPLSDLANSDQGGTSYVLGAPGVTYVVFNDRNGSDWSLDLSGATGTFQVRWFDPRGGGGLQVGTQSAGIPAGADADLGSAPYDTDDDWVAVVTRTDGGNIGPSVQITSPLPGARFDAPADVDVVAQASDVDGSVIRVTLLLDDDSQGDRMTPPYEWRLESLPVGRYSVVAEAEDDEGAVTSSSAITFDVAEPGSGPQITSLTLVDATNDVALRTLTEGSTVLLLEALSFNVTADGTSDVASVDFSLTGAESREHTEGVAPFALWGDSSGDFNEWIPTTGSYTLSATPKSTNGTPGTTVSLSFTVVEGTSDVVFLSGFESP